MTRNIKLHIEDDYNALSLKAANIFAEQIKASPSGAFGFATGSSPIGMYEELKRMHLQNEINMSQITAFNLDEYYPIRPTDKQSYRYFMAHALFDEIGLPADKRNIPNGEAPDPKAECIAYEKKIASIGGIEMQILGIGHNGHIGFNEPADIFAGATGYVQLAENTIQSNSRFFESEEDVPRYALTMGIQTIMMAKSIIMIVSGDAKAEILRDSLIGPITPLVPASALQLHRNVIVVADKAAAKLL